MKKAIWIVLALATANPAFAQGRDRNTEPAPPEKPELQASPPAPAPLPGALWSEVAARQLMGIDGNARQVGDLITIRVSERSFTSLDASTSTEKSSSSEAAISALFGAEKTLGDALPNAGANGIGMGASSAAEFDGSGSTARGAQLEAVLTCEVTEVLANGNLRVWGRKKLSVGRETQWLVLQGVIRPRDIQMDNTVASELIAELELETVGSGVVTDRGSGPGWGARVLDFLWPF